MPVALSGCVIVKQDPNGTRVTYKKKCEQCGWLDGGSTSTTVSGTSILRTGFTCPKCRVRREIRIQGTK